MLEYAATEQLLILIVTLLVPPVLILVILILLLATFGKSLGLRRAYVNLLLRIFEVCKVKLVRFFQTLRKILIPAFEIPSQIFFHKRAFLP